MNPKHLKQRILRARNRIAKEGAAATKTQTSVEKLDEDTRLIQRYRSGVITAQELTNGLEAIKARRQEHRADHSNKQSRNHPWPGITKMCRRLAKRLEDPAPASRQQIFRDLIDEATVFVDEVRIRGKITAESLSGSTVVNQMAGTRENLMAIQSANELSCEIASSQSRF